MVRAAEHAVEVLACGQLSVVRGLYFLPHLLFNSFTHLLIIAYAISNCICLKLASGIQKVIRFNMGLF